jgi:hypothetical protein
MPSAAEAARAADPKAIAPEQSSAATAIGGEIDREAIVFPFMKPSPDRRANS